MTFLVICPGYPHAHGSNFYPKKGYQIKKKKNLSVTPYYYLHFTKHYHHVIVHKERLTPYLPSSDMFTSFVC